MRRNKFNPLDVAPFPQFLPNSNWKTPNDFPNLSTAKELYVDLETYDPNLTSKGPGSIRKDGFVCGIAIGTEDAEWYFPTRHSGGNCDLSQVIRWTRDTLCHERQPKIAAKGDYDREWLASEGITTKGTWYDVQLAEALIDEEKETYSLDSLALEYLGEGKEEGLLKETAAWWGDAEASKKIMHLLEARHVGPYATGDIRKTRGVYHKQQSALDKQGLLAIYELESKLSEVVFHMRQRGVRLDEERCRSMAKEYRSKEDEIYLRLRREFCGNRNVNLSSGEEIAGVCRQLSLQYPRTKEGNPSFKKEWLAYQDHPFLKGIHEWREINTLRSKFLEGYFLSTLHKGRIHAQFTQTATEEGGARYGRFACRMPPLQQIPNRSENGKKLRTLLLPDEGKIWCKNDYSQQEYRMIVHYAMLTGQKGGEEAGQYYINDWDADYHEIVAKMTGLDRANAKNANFAKAYGAGVAKFALMTKKTLDEAKKIMETYDDKVPFVKLLSDFAQSRATTRGWIKTIGDRVLHFDKWEPKWAEEDENGERLRYRGLSFEEATAKWPNTQLKRSGVRKACNRLIQGGSGDQTKMAMLSVYEKFGYVPMLQVHDELNFSVDSKDQGLQINKVMENVIKLLVPSRVDMGLGENWGEAK